MTAIKICGIFRDCDTEYINTAMPDFTGFVFYPKSHRYVSDKTAESLKSKIKSGIKTVGVFVNDSPSHISSLYSQGLIDIIQLHGDEDNAYIHKLKHEIPASVIWKAFKIKSENDIKSAKESIADSVILDNGYGTGKCFDWSLINDFNRKFIMAGGLNPENVRNAIERFHPWAVDLSSGVETNNVKDYKKIQSAVKNVKQI